MHSSLIGKIQKAHLYAEEPSRVDVTDFSATFRGDHGSYTVRYASERWSCTCSFFPQWGVCSHIMATQRMMGPIAPHDREPADSQQAAATA